MISSSQWKEGIGLELEGMIRTATRDSAPTQLGTTISLWILVLPELRRLK
jgi:hypothetical protein